MKAYVVKFMGKSTLKPFRWWSLLVLVEFETLWLGLGEREIFWRGKERAKQQSKGKKKHKR